GIIFIGVILFVFRQYVRKVFILFPRVLSFDTLYNNTLEYMDYFAKKITNFYMTGFLKHYFMYIFLFFIFILGGTFMYFDVFAFSLQNNQTVDVFCFMIVVMIIIF